MFGHGWQCTMVKSAIHTLSSHHSDTTANHGQTWSTLKNLGTMVNLMSHSNHESEDNMETLSVKSITLCATLRVENEDVWFLTE